MKPSGCGSRLPQQQRQLELWKDLAQNYLNRLHTSPELEATIHSMEVAFRMQTEAPEIFDIRKESPATLASYGEGNFARGCIMARRMVEHGVRFVQLYHGNWDHHTDIFPSLRRRLPVFDRTIAALIEDLRQRGLLETTLVLALGEFGRTPQVNRRGGRDHWSSAMSVLFAGGGTPGGQVVGATDVRGYSAVERVLSPENFASTVYAKLGINPDKVLYTPTGRPTRTAWAWHRRGTTGGPCSGGSPRSCTHPHGSRPELSAPPSRGQPLADRRRGDRCPDEPPVAGHDRGGTAMRLGYDRRRLAWFGTRRRIAGRL